MREPSVAPQASAKQRADGASSGKENIVHSLGSRLAEGVAWGAAGFGAVLNRRFWNRFGGAPQSLLLV